MGKFPPIIWMFIGILVYEVSGIASFVFSWALYLKMLGLLVTIVAFIQAPKNRDLGSASTAAMSLLIVVVFMVMRGSIIGCFPYLNGYYDSIYEIIRHFLVYDHSAAAIMMPFVMLVDINYTELKYFRPIAIFSATISLLLCFYFKDYILQGSQGFISMNDSVEEIAIRGLAGSVFIGLGLILCMSWASVYNMKLWHTLLLLITLVLYFVFEVMGGGRGGSVSSFCYILIFLYFSYKYASKGSFLSRRFMTIVVVAILAFALVYSFKNTNMFDYLIYRSFEGHDVNSGLRSSSREGFMDMMVQDFNNHPLSWIFGRGVNGVFDMGGGLKRHTLEWGYMWLILKGGILYLLFYVLVLFKTFKNGFFKSNNALSKSLAVLCLVQILLLIPFGVPAVSVQFLLVWHSVRLLNSPEFTELSDNDMSNLINARYGK